MVSTCTALTSVIAIGISDRSYLAVETERARRGRPSHEADVSGVAAPKNSWMSWSFEEILLWVDRGATARSIPIGKPTAKRREAGPANLSRGGFWNKRFEGGDNGRDRGCGLRWAEHGEACGRKWSCRESRPSGAGIVTDFGSSVSEPARPWWRSRIVTKRKSETPSQASSPQSDALCCGADVGGSWCGCPSSGSYCASQLAAVVSSRAEAKTATLRSWRYPALLWTSAANGQHLPRYAAGTVFVLQG